MTAHVAVLMGGWSSEREVSLASGKACSAALRVAGYRVSEIDVDRDIGNVLAKTRPDICFNALHGPMGEDGNIQGLLNIMGMFSAIFNNLLIIYLQNIRTEVKKR